MHQRTTLTSQYIALFSEGKKIRDKLPTQTHTTSTVHAAFTCDQFVKKKKNSFAFHKQLLNFDLQIFFTISCGGKKKSGTQYQSKANITNKIITAFICDECVLREITTCEYHIQKHYFEHLIYSPSTTTKC